jgi:phosphoribosylanthranilate isomerase
MQRVRVKIEGLRDPATAVRVAELGADAIGLVFAESPRRVTPEQAREIVSALPPSVATVGVFVNAPPDEINRVIDLAGIRIVQLHGDEPPEIVAKVHAPCIKAFRVKDKRWVSEVRRWLRKTRDSHQVSSENMVTVPSFVQAALDRLVTPRQDHPEGFAANTPAVLLDAYDPAVRGGSGRRFNWDLIARARDALASEIRAGGPGDVPGIGPIVLAGGLDAGCVAEAIRKVRPWAVDVASGVESSPGVKDLGKVKAFLEAVHQASI